MHDEVKVGWFKAKASGGQGGSCVEVNLQAEPGSVLVRDSKDPQGPHLTFTPAEWNAFLNGAKHDEFDL